MLRILVRSVKPDQERAALHKLHGAVLGQELRQIRSPEHVGFPDHLDRDRLAGAEVLGEVHASKTAAADRADDLKVAGGEGAADVGDRF